MIKTSIQNLNDRLRLLLLLDACEAADLTPIPVMRLHALAFLANLLAPVWSINWADGKILKRRGGPFYPELQKELDGLVGLGIVTVYGINHKKDQEGHWRLEGSFGLNDSLAGNMLEVAKEFISEKTMIDFLRRLAFATARLTDPLESLISSDVTWADNRTGTGDVIDFAEWQRANYTAAAANYFNKVSPLKLKISRGDKLQLYMSLLEKRKVNDRR